VVAIFYHFVITVEWTELYTKFTRSLAQSLPPPIYILYFRYVCFIPKPERLKDEAKFRTFWLPWRIRGKL